MTREHTGKWTDLGRHYKVNLQPKPRSPANPPLKPPRNFSHPVKQPPSSRGFKGPTRHSYASSHKSTRSRTRHERRLKNTDRQMMLVRKLSTIRTRKRFKHRPISDGALHVPRTRRIPKRRQLCATSLTFRYRMSVTFEIGNRHNCLRIELRHHLRNMD